MERRGFLASIAAACLYPLQARERMPWIRIKRNAPRPLKITHVQLVNDQLTALPNGFISQAEYERMNQPYELFVTGEGE